MPIKTIVFPESPFEESAKPSMQYKLCTGILGRRHEILWPYRKPKKGKPTMLPSNLRYWLFDRMSVKTMRYVTAVPNRKATGLTKQVYDMIEQDFFQYRLRLVTISAGRSRVVLVETGLIVADVLVPDVACVLMLHRL